MKQRRLLLGLAFLGAAGCGGGGAPLAPSTPAPDVPAGTTMTVSYVHTGVPASGLTVTLLGRTYTTDAAGQLRLENHLRWGDLVDVVGSDVLQRQTLMRASAGTALTVWPRETPNGISPDYVAMLVYTPGTADPGPGGAAPLLRLRPGTAEVFVVPSAQIQENRRELGAHREASARITSASGERVRYTVVTERPATGVVVTTSFAPDDPHCLSAQPTAFTRYQLSSAREIVGAEIVYCSPTVVDYVNLILHELGHTFGLQHSPDPTEVMRAPARSSGYLSARESEAMLLLLARPAGNRYPDKNRSVVAAGSATMVIVCY